jgi:hypothetical protein
MLHDLAQLLQSAHWYHLAESRSRLWHESRTRLRHESRTRLPLGSELEPKFFIDDMRALIPPKGGTLADHCTHVLLSVQLHRALTHFVELARTADRNEGGARVSFQRDSAALIANGILEQYRELHSRVVRAKTLVH